MNIQQYGFDDVAGDTSFLPAITIQRAVYVRTYKATHT